MENLTAEQPNTDASAANPSARVLGPLSHVGTAPSAPPSAPQHTRTESTLAPTSEFVRYLLLALPARYIARSGIESALNDKAPGIVKRVVERIASLFKHTGIDRAKGSDIAYDYALGAGSLALTTTYTRLVYKDIQNMFCETVGLELGKPADQVTFSDITHSDNKIVAKTLHNFKVKTAERFGTDLLFFSRAIPALRWLNVGDLMIGVKAALALGDTWKRKTTMFEDLVTFVNNKINPRNGLGQPIGVGEVFDLYQHYEQAYHPTNAFKDVLERGTDEGARWAQSQPIFQRITELMNLTYAYKHSTVLDPQTGQAVHQAEFTLPVFVYLLGHDLIDVNKPERTLATIEIANRYGIAAVKDMQAQLASGASLADITTRYPVPAHKATDKKTDENEKNSVIAKGSTMQLERAEPASRIDVDSIHHHQTVTGTAVTPALA
ncbi:MAG: hypothetical protein V4735_03325 [Pseudomonadota bacterium]